MKFVFLCSTGGSVFRRVYESGHLAGAEIEVVADRECGAIDFADSEGIPSVVLSSQSGAEFSAQLYKRYGECPDTIFFLFYSRIIAGDFLHKNTGRIVNFHPSILPAFPGLHGFEDGMASSVTLIGSTVHFIDQDVDTGPIIMQAAYPRSAKESVEQLRHRIFRQQCAQLLQVLRWYQQGRIRMDDGMALIKAAGYQIGEFSPCLEADAKNLYAEIN